MLPLLTASEWIRLQIWILQGWEVGGAAGFDTGNREKLSSTQATPAWVLLSFSLFLVSNPAAPTL